MAYNMVEINEPSNIQDALQSHYSEKWKATADSEYNSLIENKTWELVPLTTSWTNRHWFKVGV